MNIPNSLTLGRIVLVPLIVWLIITHEMLPAFLLFLLAGLVLAELGLGLGLEGLVALLIWVTGTLTIVSAAAYFLSWLRQMASYEPQSKQVPWRKRDGVEHAPSERVPADRSGARAS